MDVITQWYILEILKKINDEKGITIIFLTHDISIIGSMVDRIAVMYAGQFVEVGDVLDVYEHPKHPYTRALLDAIPSLHDDITTRRSIKGNPIDMLNLNGECRYKSRCDLRMRVGCDGSEKNSEELVSFGEGQCSRCRFGESV